MAEKKNGRPSKLTPEITARFLDAIKLGAPYQLACNYAGITYQTMLNWRDRTEDVFLEFFEAIKQAEGEAAIQWLTTLDKHSEADARWAAWKLERRYPHEFGRRDRMPIDERELDRQFRETLAGIEAGGETSIPASAESTAVN